MRKEHDDRIDPTRPALIVQYGSTRRKFRPLEGDVVVVGRSAGCDIGIVSPEVAPVHCVLVRLPGGWRIHDCSGRGTRVNGKSIHDEPLRNGDTIQVGTFSFEAQLPPGTIPPPAPAGPAVAPASLQQPDNERLQESRRRLAELALGLRRRLREQAGDRVDVARQQADLEQVERRMRQAHQEQMTRQTELTRRSEELDSYARHLKRQAETLRQEASEQARLASEERAGFEAELVRQQVEQNQEADRLTQWQRDLQARQAELETMSEQLNDALAREREQVDRDREQVARERDYLDRERQQVVGQRADLERIKDQVVGQTPAPVSSRETQLDATTGGRLESARKLLRELNERRKPAAPVGNGSRSRQIRPPSPDKEEGGKRKEE